MKAVLMYAYGGPHVLQYTDVPDVAPEPGEALVRMEACGVTHLDLDVRSGVSRIDFELPHILGRDLAGEVVAVNEADWPRIGDKVIAPLQMSCMKASCSFCSTGRDNLCAKRVHPGVSGPGGYREFATFRADSLRLLPANLTYVDAIATMQPYATAWHCLITTTGVTAGETVLITGAAGSIGVAMVRMAKLIGARVIAAVGSDSRLNTVVSAGIPLSNIINYARNDLAAEALRITNDKGVEAVIDIVGGKVFTDAFKALAPDGRLCVVGAHGGESVQLDLVEVFRRQIKILGSSGYTHEEIGKVLEMTSDGLLVVPPYETMHLSEAAEAHRRIEARENLGKIVLVP